jgi:murein peptide amidase A
MTSPTHPRSFKTIIDRLEAFSRLEKIPLEVLGEISADGETLPILKLELNPHSEAQKSVLISGGIHGDEPAGVETICEFLTNKLYTPFLKDWQITILPCLNPSGYQRDTRNNYDDKDLNRLFKLSTSSTEVEIAQKVLTSPFDLTLELHEDCDSDGYYLFQKENLLSEPPLGRMILNAIEPIMPINRNSEIEEIPADNGLINRLKEPGEMPWWPMALYSYFIGCKRCFTLETSPKLPMDVRVKAHLKAIETALNEY